jgi:hypothetical protein
MIKTHVEVTPIIVDGTVLTDQKPRLILLDNIDEVHKDGVKNAKLLVWRPEIDKLGTMVLDESYDTIRSRILF